MTLTYYVPEHINICTDKMLCLNEILKIHQF